MSNPKQEYGHVIIDTEEKRRVFSKTKGGDGVWFGGEWCTPVPNYTFDSTRIYRRRISPGDGFEIVLEGESEAHGMEYTLDGLEWHHNYSPKARPVSSWGAVLAFRRPIKQPATPPVEPCPVAKRVADRVISRAETGMKKYGVNLERGDLTLGEWLQHLQDELLDAAAYVERLKSEGLKSVSPAEPSPWQLISTADLSAVRDGDVLLGRVDQNGDTQTVSVAASDFKIGNVPKDFTHWQPISPVPKPKPMTEEEALNELMESETAPGWKAYVQAGWNAHIAYLKKGGK